MPKISVVIPTYNRASYLDAAIASALAQRGADFEVIVSDNNSGDDTQKVVSKYLTDHRVRYFRNDENIGMVRNWRKAIYEYAVGDWFVLLSDDDYLIDPDYLAKASQLIENNSSLVMVYAEGYLLDENTGEQESLVLPFEGVVAGVDVFISRGTIRPQDFTLCNVVFNRSMTIELNGISNANNLSCDSELFLRLALMGDVGVIKGAVSVYRFHSGNLIKTVYKSPELAGGNMDFLLSPYLFAKDRITSEQMLIFKKNTKLERFVAYSLLVVACHSWESFLKLRQETVARAPELLEGETNTVSFRLQLFLCRIGGWKLPVVLILRAKVKRFLKFFNI